MNKAMNSKLKLSGSKDQSDKYLLNRLVPQQTEEYAEEEEEHEEISDDEAEDLYQKIISKNKTSMDDSDQESDELETENQPSTTQEMDDEISDDEESDDSEDGSLNFSDEEISDEDDTKLGNWKKNKKDVYVEKESQQNKKKFASKEDRERSLLQKIDEEKAEVAQVLASTKNRSDRLSTSDLLGDFQTGEEDEIDNEVELEIDEVDGALDDEEKMRIIRKESPELVELVEELKKNLKSIRSQLHPLMTKLVFDCFLFLY